MKKYLNVVLSAVLVLLALSIYANSSVATVVAGRGSGTDYEVEEIEDLYSVLCYLSGESTNGNTLQDANYGLSLLSTNGERNMTQQAERDIEEHDSVTVEEFTEMSMKTTYKRAVDNYDYSNPYVYPPTSYEIIGYSTSKMRRNLTMYLTEDATFYISSGCFTSTYHDREDSENDTDVFMVFDMEMYHDEDVTLVKINRLEMSINRNIVTVNAEYVGKWMKWSQSDAHSIISMADMQNHEYMAKIQKMIESEILGTEAYDFEKINDIYTIEDKELGAEVTIDLSDARRPTVEYLMVQNDEDTSDDYCYGCDVYTFSNIDNTVINANTDSDSIIDFEDSDDFEDLFLTKDSKTLEDIFKP